MPSSFSVRDYRDPHTGLGVDLANVSSRGASSFALHEVGKRDYENWNHRGILSPYWRLHHNAKVGNAVRFEGREFPLTPSNALLTPAATRIDTLGHRTVPHLWIHYTPLQEFVLALRTPVSVTLSAAGLQALQDLRQALPQDSEDPLDPEAYHRLYHLSKAVLHLVFAALPNELFQTFPPKLYRILEHIDSHLAEDLHTKRLAQLSGYSSDHFSRWFREHLGESPSRYVLTVRIRAAMKALSAAEPSIEQIAEDLGFPNRYYFSRVFSRHLGCGPASFRRGQR